MFVVVMLRLIKFDFSDGTMASLIVTVWLIVLDLLVQYGTWPENTVVYTQIIDNMTVTN